MAAAASILMKKKRGAIDEDAESDGRVSPTPASGQNGGSGGDDGPPIYWKHQLAVYRFYNRQSVQIAVAAIIVTNFIVTITEKEIDPFPTAQKKYADLWKVADLTFNVLFALELCLNFAGSWFFRFFWKNPWNVFDFVVVTVGVVSMTGVLEGSPLEDIKMLRFFRVFRLFKRVPSLNKIVTALLLAIPGVLNAFVIMLIVMCIYAIFAVEYFRNHGEDGYYLTEETVMIDGVPTLSQGNVTSLTPREMHYGLEYFGTFSRALYTLFQVLTGESWSEMVARPLIFGANPSNAFGSALFFTSFILLTQIVLVNVVVAVLLDKFVTEPPTPEGEEQPAGPFWPAGPEGPSSPFVPPASAPGTASAQDALTAQVEGLRADVRSLKEQMSDVVELKQKLSALLDALPQLQASTGATAREELGPMAA